MKPHIFLVGFLLLLAACGGTKTAKVMSQLQAVDSCE